MKPDSAAKDEGTVLRLLIRVLESRLQTLQGSAPHGAAAPAHPPHRPRAPAQGGPATPAEPPAATSAEPPATTQADTPEVARLRRALCRDRPRLAASPRNALHPTAPDLAEPAPEPQMGTGAGTAAGTGAGTGADPAVARVPPLRGFGARPRKDSAARQSG